MANGLPSNEVFSILKDKKGFVWIATDRGVCKFDGETFKLFTTTEGLCENSTLEIKEDKLGRIWCRSFTGMFTVLDADSVYGIDVNKQLVNSQIGNGMYQFELDDSINLYIGTRLDGKIYKSN